MIELIDFCIDTLKSIVGTYMNLQLGGYSFGLFLVATSVISVFISTLVISFKQSAGSPGQYVKPFRSKSSRSKRPARGGKSKG